MKIKELLPLKVYTITLRKAVIVKETAYVPMENKRLIPNPTLIWCSEIYHRGYVLSSRINVSCGHNLSSSNVLFVSSLVNCNR